MKVFLGWSGDLSHEIALVLRQWLPRVIQTLKPFVSSEDISKGVRWTEDLARELEASSFGIVSVTRDNMSAPWLIFEAGALSNVVNNRVAPFLVDIRLLDLDRHSPLLHFQTTLPEKEDVAKLIESLNEHADNPQHLDPITLRDTFEMWWPRLHNAIAEAIKRAPATVKPTQRDPAETQEEILELVRVQHRLLSGLPEQLALRPAPLPVQQPVPRPEVAASLREFMEANSQHLLRQIESKYKSEMIGALVKRLGGELAATLRGAAPESMQVFIRDSIGAVLDVDPRGVRPLVVSIQGTVHMSPPNMSHAMYELKGYALVNFKNDEFVGLPELLEPHYLGGPLY